MSSLLASLGSGSARHPWRVITAVIVSLLMLGGLAGAVGAGFTDEVRLGDTDSQRAADLLSDRFPAAAGDTATIVVHSEDAPGVTASEFEVGIS